MNENEELAPYRSLHQREDALTIASPPSGGQRRSPRWLLSAMGGTALLDPLILSSAVQGLVASGGTVWPDVEARG